MRSSKPLPLVPAHEWWANDRVSRYGLTSSTRGKRGSSASAGAAMLVKAAPQSWPRLRRVVIRSGVACRSDAASTAHESGLTMLCQRVNRCLARARTIAAASWTTRAQLWLRLVDRSRRSMSTELSCSAGSASRGQFLTRCDCPQPTRRCITLRTV